MVIFLLRFALACALLAPTVTEAQPVVYDSKSTFLAETGATSATGPLPIIVGNPWTITVGEVTFLGGPVNNTLQMKEWSARLTGNELAIDGVENFDIALTSPDPVYSIGFDFVEPQFDPLVNGPFVDSTFNVTLLAGQQIVSSFMFSRPNDQATFVGAWSDVPFDRLEIREVVGENGNEFFGEFYVGHIPEGTVAVDEATLGEVKAKYGGGPVLR